MVELDVKLAELSQALADVNALERGGVATLPAQWQAALCQIGVELPAAAAPKQAITAIWKRAGECIDGDLGHRLTERAPAARPASCERPVTSGSWTGPREPGPGSGARFRGPRR